MNSKSKGNRFELQVAKKLSKWFFNDETVLYRHESSGARKINYVGDIIPKDIEKFTWKKWPFIIEVKSGYKNNIPTFCGGRKLFNSWIIKLLSEKTEKQFIPILIFQFYRHPIYLMTPLIFHLCDCELAYPIEFNDEKIIFYEYLFEELLKYDFYQIFNENFLLERADHEYISINQFI